MRAVDVERRKPNDFSWGFHDNFKRERREERLKEEGTPEGRGFLVELHLRSQSSSLCTCPISRIWISSDNTTGMVAKQCQGTFLVEKSGQGVEGICSPEGREG